MNWDEIKNQARECRKSNIPEERIKRLKELFEQTNDGWVAYQLGQEYEGNNTGSALEYYRIAEERLPFPEYRFLAEQAVKRLEGDTKTKSNVYAYLITDEGKKDITTERYSNILVHKSDYPIFIDGFTKEVCHNGQQRNNLTDSEFIMIKTYIETGKSLAPFQVTGYVKEYKKTEENIAWNDKKFNEMVDKGDTIDEEKWEFLRNSSEFAEEILQRIAESAYAIFKSARRKVDIKQDKEFVYFPQTQRRGRDRLAKYQFKPENLTYCLIIPS